MQDINALLDKALEIEGLLRVLMIRDDRQVRELLRQKSQSLFQALNGDEEQIANDDFFTIDPDGDFSVDIVEFDEEAASAGNTALQPEAHSPAPQQAPAPDTQELPNAASAQSAESPTPQDAIGAQPAAEAQATQAMPGSPNTQELASTHTTEPIPAPTPHAPKSFVTFNEKYRFARELFNNQHALMSEVVEKVTSMQSLPEAHDYVLNELGLDENNPVVIEFLEVIARYFNSRT